MRVRHQCSVWWTTRWKQSKVSLLQRRRRSWCGSWRWQGFIVGSAIISRMWWRPWLTFARTPGSSAQLNARLCSTGGKPSSTVCGPVLGAPDSIDRGKAILYNGPVLGAPDSIDRGKAILYSGPVLGAPDSKKGSALLLLPVASEQVPSWRLREMDAYVKISLCKIYAYAEIVSLWDGQVCRKLSLCEKDAYAKIIFVWKGTLDTIVHANKHTK